MLNKDSSEWIALLVVFFTALFWFIHFFKKKGANHLAQYFLKRKKIKIAMWFRQIHIRSNSKKCH